MHNVSKRFAKSEVQKRNYTWPVKSTGPAVQKGSLLRDRAQPRVELLCKNLPLKLSKYECTMDQELWTELLVGSRRTLLLLHMQQWVLHRCCMYTHQMAAYSSIKKK